MQYIPFCNIMLQVHRARGWGKVAPQEGFAIRRGECNIMTLKET